MELANNDGAVEPWAFRIFIHRLLANCAPIVPQPAELLDDRELVL